MHLVQKWLPALDKKIESSFEQPHENYRIFISAEPAADPLYHIIPQVFFLSLNIYFLNINDVFVII